MNRNQVVALVILVPVVVLSGLLLGRSFDGSNDAPAGIEIGGADDATVERLRRYALNIGLAFQIVDDILDITQTSEQLGKSAGKDAAAGKATYPAVFGIEKSRREAARLTKAARKALEPFGKKADFLHAIADQLLGREN